MKKNSVVLICVVAVMILAACSMQSDTKELSGAQLLKKKCKRCHSYKRPLEMRKSRLQWQRTVQRMWDRDPAAMTAEDVQKIIDYLVRERGTGE